MTRDFGTRDFGTWLNSVLELFVSQSRSLVSRVLQIILVVVEDGLGVVQKLNRMVTQCNVLILVVVEDGLGEQIMEIKFDFSNFVLILVVVEDGLGAPTKNYDGL